MYLIESLPDLDLLLGNDLNEGDPYAHRFLSYGSCESGSVVDFLDFFMSGIITSSA